MTSQPSSRDRTRPATRDSGFTLIEIVVAVVLTGLVVVGTMTGLRTTILAGTLHRDHSKAHQWLQSASDLLYAAPKVSCSTAVANVNEPAIRAAYEQVIDSAPDPEGWVDWQIKITGTVRFWNSGQLDADSDEERFFGAACDPNLTLQLIEIEVRGPNGKIIESVEIVK